MLSDAACARDAQKIFRPLSSIAATIDGPISKTSRARKQQLTATPHTDEYDAAQEGGEVAGHGGGKVTLESPRLKKLGCPTINCTKRGRSGTPKRNGG